MNNKRKYFLWAFIFWLVVDFTTTDAIKNPGQYYSTYMPAILIFYIGYPLIFAYLIYGRRIGKKALFFSMIAGMFIVEVFFTKNPLMYQFPLFFLGIPAGVSIYGFITYVPKWIVEKRIKENEKKVIIMTVVWIIISLASLVG